MKKKQLLIVPVILFSLLFLMNGVQAKAFDVVVEPIYNSTTTFIDTDFYPHTLNLTGNCTVNVSVVTQNCGTITGQSYYWNGQNYVTEFDCQNPPFHLSGDLIPLDNSCGQANLVVTLSNGTSTVNYQMPYDPDYYIVIDDVNVTNYDGYDEVCIDWHTNKLSNVCYQMMDSHGNILNDTWGCGDFTCANLTTPTGAYILQLQNEVSYYDGEINLNYRTWAHALSHELTVEKNGVKFIYPKYVNMNIIRYYMAGVVDWFNTTEYYYTAKVLSDYNVLSDPSALQIEVEKIRDDYQAVEYKITNKISSMYALIGVPIPDNFNGEVKLNGEDVNYTIENDTIIIDPLLAYNQPNTITLGRTYKITGSTAFMFELLTVILAIAGVLIIIKFGMSMAGKTTDYVKFTINMVIVAIFIVVAILVIQSML